MLRICLVSCFLLTAGVLHAAGNDRGDLYKLQMENRRLRKELDRLRSELAKQDQDLLKFRQWVGSVSDSGKIQSVSERENRLISMLSELLKRCSRLVVQTAEVERSFRELINDLPLSPAKQARLLLQLEKLERASMQAAAISGVVEAESDPQAFRELQVVAVNRELETAVLSGGSVHGVFPGLIYQAKDGRQLQLRIISVRPWVSAAVPVAGNLDMISPGMIFSAARKRTTR